MTKQILSAKARRYALIGMIWCGLNFAFFVTNMLRNGTSAFPGGTRDELGYFTIDHGKRYDFTRSGFIVSYWQGLVTCVSIPLYLVGIFVLHATGDIKSVRNPAQ